MFIYAVSPIQEGGHIGQAQIIGKLTVMEARSILGLNGASEPGERHMLQLSERGRLCCQKMQGQCDRLLAVPLLQSWSTYVAAVEGKDCCCCCCMGTGKVSVKILERQQSQIAIAWEG